METQFLHLEVSQIDRLIDYGKDLIIYIFYKHWGILNFILDHAYFFLKSNIAMLIFGVGKINRFYFLQKKSYISSLKTKLIQNLEFDNEKRKSRAILHPH